MQKKIIALSNKYLEYGTTYYHINMELRSLVNNNFLDNNKLQLLEGKRQTVLSFAALILSIIAIITAFFIALIS